MSTRSGKRLHGSFREDTVNNESEVTHKTERKTRGKPLKDTEEENEVTLPNSKKRVNYVSYPIDDEQMNKTGADVIEMKPTRKTKRYTLKEHDPNIPENEKTDTNSNVDSKKTARITRQNKKNAESSENAEHNDDASEPVGPVEPVEPVPNGKAKVKKNKKKKAKKSSEGHNSDVKTVSKKSKKKKGKSPGSPTKNSEVVKLNGSNISTDSFHSAAGSPLSEHIRVNINKSTPDKNKKTTPEKTKKTTPEKTKKMNTTFEKSEPKKSEEVKQSLNETFEKKTRRSSIRNKTLENDLEKLSDSKSDDDKVKEMDLEKPNNIIGHTRKSLLSSFNGEDDAKNEGAKKLNTTFDKETRTRKSMQCSNDDSDMKEASPKKLNITFEKETRRKSLHTSMNGNNTSVILNTTFEKCNKNQNKAISLDSTFDKTDKLNTTFDKNDQKSDSQKSSLISSDASNLTYDKDDISRISITSDDSRTGNIVNSTPVLIESSMDESCLSSSKKSLDNNKSVEKSKVSPTVKVPEKTPITPLKREGTFTKESPDPKRLSRTPSKRMSLPSPGCTPFHTTRSSQKSVFNVTRSIEKSRRSSLAEPAPARQTRVMFCSPGNDAAAATTMRKTVIKSSLKGSNKSFVFEDAASVPRTAGRKRGFTASEADVPRAKRTRPAPAPAARPPAPAARPSASATPAARPSAPADKRYRSSSATAKPTTTPTKKLSPVRAKSSSKRTALPNFAALHARGFARMESLADAQARRQLRARALLTPSGGPGLRRGSPRVSPDQLKPKEPAKKVETPAKAPKLPTLESLRPGFTRFGFKMTTEHNPFSFTAKNDNKTKEREEKRNGMATRSTLPVKTTKKALPTLEIKLPKLPIQNFAMASRKEVAKQTVMREKSFTSLSGKRDAKRDERRTVIKGVRTNRRFDLQMKMRNIE